MKFLNYMVYLTHTGKSLSELSFSFERMCYHAIITAEQAVYD